MSDDDYLWNRQGRPDPEVERLERTLAVLRSPARPVPPPGLFAEPLRGGRGRARWAWFLGLGASLAAATGILLLRPGQEPDPRPPAGSALTIQAAPAWPLTVLAGRARIEGRAIDDSKGLATGQTIETDEGARVRLAVPSIGSVEVDASTRVRLVGTGPNEHRLQLERGALHVVVTAPPGIFFVETPAGVAVDLGCAYTVEVGTAGDGLVRVHAGWVGFELAGRESFIPAGAECPIRAGRGPGTPRFSDASDRFRHAVVAFDAPARPEEQALEVRTILAEARPRDAVTLWHLLGRVSPEARAGVLRRLVDLVPSAASVPRQQVLAGQRDALDQLWNRLGLDPIALWRHWQVDLDRKPAR